MKKVLITAMVVFAVIIGALAAIPMFYDIDAKARPMILQAIEQNMDVDAKMGKLSLSLFGGIKIGIESLLLSGKTTHATLVRLQNAQVVLPYTALLAGRVRVTLKAVEPEINVTRYEDGSINILKLLKTKSVEPTNAAGSGPGGAGSALASRVSISVDIAKAKLDFKDLQSKINYQIQDLNVDAEDIGVNQPIQMKITAGLAVDNKKDILLDGRVKLEGTTQINMDAQGFKGADIALNGDLGDLQIKYGNLLNKARGTQLNFVSKLSATPNFVHIDTTKLQVANFFVETKGDIDNFKNPQFNLEIKTNDIELSQVKDIVGMVKDFGLRGTAQAEIKISGTSQKPKLEGHAKLRDVELKMASMLAPITKINMNAEMTGDQIKITNTSMNIGGGEIQANGIIENLGTPIINFKITSAGIDINKIMPPPSKTAGAKSVEKPTGPTLAQSMAAPLAMIRSNEFLRRSTMDIAADIKRMTYGPYDISDLKAEATLKNLVFTMKNSSIKIFKGTITPSLQVELAPAKPSYQFKAGLSSLDINAAIVSKMKDLDKSLTGSASGQITISGVGIDEADFKKNLKGSAQFNVKDGTWSGTAVLKKIGEELSKIPKVGEALSKLKVGDKFKTLNATMIIQNGELNITKSRAEMEQTNASIETTGTIDFDKRLNLRGDLLAPLGGVPKDLKAADGRAKIPFEMHGTAESPEIDWQKTLGVVAKAYAKDEGKKLLNNQVNKIKEQLLKKFHF